VKFVMTGVLFDIKRFAVNDGPGIRTTVFLKGCPLRCAWCHNPESQDARTDIDYQARLCIGCQACVQVCPKQALTRTPGSIARDRDRCDRCGICAEACPTEALRKIGWRAEASELLSQIVRDVAFFDESGGGVTFSGGEPLAQPEFLAEMLEQCSQQGMHRAVDTCGYADPKTMAEIAARTDLILFDLKLMDSADHLRHTGVTNERILDNLRALAARDVAVQVRVPIIPGLTDTAQNIDAMIVFLQMLPRRLPVRLLPYHRSARTKYQRFGIPDRLPETPEPTAQALTLLAKRFASTGFAVTHGG
jgi:pyruvate formate lyase activating enzyme